MRRNPNQISTLSNLVLDLRRLRFAHKSHSFNFPYFYNGREHPAFQPSFTQIAYLQGLSEGSEGGHEYGRKIGTVPGSRYSSIRRTNPLDLNLNAVRCC